MTRDEAATVVLEKVLDAEGGIADVGDGAGLTRFGQTSAWLSTFGFQPPATRDEALANYRVWLVRTHLIEVCDYPDALAHKVVDWAVNTSHTVAIIALQRALGLKADGILGPETQTAIEGCDRRQIAGKVFAAHLRFRGELITGNPIKFARFARGWLYRDATLIPELVS